MKKTRFAIVFLVLTLAIFAAAPSFAASTLTISPYETEVPTLDPAKSNSAPSFTMISHLFENLVRIVDGRATPGAASKWTTSKDGKMLTFTLRDAKWSDGKPVTAQDFVYSMQRQLDPKVAGEYAFAAYYVKGAEDYNKGRNKDPNSVGIVAKDAKTLVITLNQPTPYFVNYLGHGSFAPSRKDYVDKYGDSYITAPDKAVYNGPYILAEWKPEQLKKLVKNPQYWNKDKIKIDTAEVLVIPDTSTQLNLFENGELDAVDVPPSMYKNYEKKGVNVFYNGAVDWMKTNVRKNPNKPWLANKNFRKAIAFAIDREAYCNTSTKGLYTPAYRFVLPIIQGVNKKYGDEYPLKYYPPKGDMAKAKDYFKKAMAELKITDPKKITIEYLIQDQEETRLMAEVLQQQIGKAFGINVKIKLVTRKQRADMENKGEYDFVYSGWMPDYNDPMTYMEIYTTDSSHNNAGYSNPAYDKLVKAAQVEANPKKRMESIFAAEKILLDDAMAIPLQMRRKAWMHNPKLVGFERPLIGAEYDWVGASFK